MIQLVLGNITEVDSFAKVYFENSALLTENNIKERTSTSEGLDMYIECPIWKGGEENEKDLLSSNYRASLQMAHLQNCQSIAFQYNCLGKEAIPDELACQYAVASVSTLLFEENSTIEVIFVCRYQYHFDLYESLLFKKIVRRSFHVTGLVQGVWYRQSTYEKAKEFNLSGSVLNQNDRKVYIEVQGSLYKIHQLFDWCLQGPPLAKVDKVKVEELSVLKGEQEFIIKR